MASSSPACEPTHQPQPSSSCAAAHRGVVWRPFAIRPVVGTLANRNGRRWLHRATRRALPMFSPQPPMIDPNRAFWAFLATAVREQGQEQYCIHQFKGLATSLLQFAHAKVGLSSSRDLFPVDSETSRRSFPVWASNSIVQSASAVANLAVAMWSFLTFLDRPARLVLVVFVALCIFLLLNPPTPSWGSFGATAQTFMAADIHA